MKDSSLTSIMRDKDVYRLFVNFLQPRPIEQRAGVSGRRAIANLSSYFPSSFHGWIIDKTEWI